MVFLLLLSPRPLPPCFASFSESPLSVYANLSSRPTEWQQLWLHCVAEKHSGFTAQSCRIKNEKVLQFSICCLTLQSFNCSNWFNFFLLVAWLSLPLQWWRRREYTEAGTISLKPLLWEGSTDALVFSLVAKISAVSPSSRIWWDAESYYTTVFLWQPKCLENRWTLNLYIDFFFYYICPILT